jgi:hypothetical protein
MRQLIRAEDIAKLEANWIEQQPVMGTENEIDFVPVVRLYLPFSTCLWILTEKDPNSSIAFGLCQITEPELGSVDLDELCDVRHPQGLRVIQDLNFKPEITLSDYARLARRHGMLSV